VSHRLIPSHGLKTDLVQRNSTGLHGIYGRISYTTAPIEPASYATYAARLLQTNAASRGRSVFTTITYHCDITTNADDLLTGLVGHSTLLVRRLAGRRNLDVSSLTLARVFADPGHLFIRGVMNSILHTDNIKLPQVLAGIVDRAMDRSKLTKSIVYVRHAIEYGYFITYNPMPRRGADLIGLVTPKGEIVWLVHEIKRLGVQITEPSDIEGSAC